MYRLQSFVGALPNTNLQEDFGAPTAPAMHIPTIGGAAFDAHGAGAAPRQGRKIIRHCWIHRATATDAHEEFRFWLALVGERRKLWREVLPTAELQWTWARLEEVRAIHDPYQFNRAYIPIEMTFALPPPATWNSAEPQGGFHHWDGEGDFGGIWTFNELTGVQQLLTYPAIFIVTNTGDRPATDARIIIAAGTEPITSLTVVVGAIHNLTYTRTIPAHGTLILDAGAKSCKLNGQPAYALTFNVGHRSPNWFQFDPGLTHVAIIATGGHGGETATFDYYHTWA